MSCAQEKGLKLGVEAPIYSPNLLETRQEDFSESGANIVYTVRQTLSQNKTKTQNCQLTFTRALAWAPTTTCTIQMNKCQLLPPNNKTKWNQTNTAWKI